MGLKKPRYARGGICDFHSIRAALVVGVDRGSCMTNWTHVSLWLLERHSGQNLPSFAHCGILGSAWAAPMQERWSWLCTTHKTLEAAVGPSAIMLLSCTNAQAVQDISESTS